MGGLVSYRHKWNLYLSSETKWLWWHDKEGLKANESSKILGTTSCGKALK